MSTASSPSRAALMRDAALARVGRTRRWVIAGTAALTAGFAALVSAVAPGRSLASKSGAGTGSVATPAASTLGPGSLPSMPPPANSSELGLQGPNQPPASAPSQPAPQNGSGQAAAPPAPQSSGGGGGVVSGGS
jgi:hypothetical protein